MQWDGKIQNFIGHADYLQGNLFLMTMLKENEFVVSTTIWHLHRYLPSTYSRIKSCAALVAEFQHFLKGVQGGEQKRHSVFGGGMKLAEQIFR